jgi:hypothetical protein
MGSREKCLPAFVAPGMFASLDSRSEASVVGLYQLKFRDSKVVVEKVGSEPDAARAFASDSVTGTQISDDYLIGSPLLASRVRKYSSMVMVGGRGTA